MNLGKKKEKARKIFAEQESAYNPYLKNEVIFNADGFHHLQFSSRRERSKKEQMLKFNLLPLAVDVIKKSGTLQEYREELISVGKRGKDGLRKTKEVKYWGFVAIMGESKVKIRVILRKVGNGNVIFWSVLPDSNLKRGQKIYATGIQNE